MNIEAFNLGFEMHKYNSRTYSSMYIANIFLIILVSKNKDIF